MLKFLRWVEKECIKAPPITKYTHTYKHTPNRVNHLCTIDHILPCLLRLGNLVLHKAREQLLLNIAPLNRLSCTHTSLNNELFCVCWYILICVSAHHVRNNYVTYIVAMRPCSSRLRQFRRVDGCFV